VFESCEHCHPDDAEIPFDWILADVMGQRGPVEFILPGEPQSQNSKKDSISNRDNHLLSAKVNIGRPPLDWNGLDQLRGIARRIRGGYNHEMPEKNPQPNDPLRLNPEPVPKPQPEPAPPDTDKTEKKKRPKRKKRG
jgi:hypothetical protein